MKETEQGRFGTLVTRMKLMLPEAPLDSPYITDILHLFQKVGYYSYKTERCLVCALHSCGCSFQ